MDALHDEESRTDLLNRLRRAEGQLRGVQRMIAEGEDCLQIAQQLSAVRKALDSAYVRMTVCYMAQELDPARHDDGDRKQDLTRVLGKVETLLAKAR